MVEEMSIWSLVINASFVVQLVMFILLAASFFSWVLIFQRYFFLKHTKSFALEFEDKFWSSSELRVLYQQSQEQPNPDSGLEHIFQAGFAEYNRLLGQGTTDPDAVMEGAQRAMRVALAREEDKLYLHLPFLASVGSVSPYIGLFGTVWGIMNSFRGLANVHQATLASVAPGISEALVATAIGLFAAIPAVLAYNRFSASTDYLLNRYETFTDEFSALLHRRVYASKEQLD